MAKVLVVEDSKELSEALSTILQLKGKEVITAYDGESAVAMALAQHPDLTLIDLRLPDISGYDVIRKIREDSWGRSAAFLILTASDEITKIPHDLGIGEDDYLTKTKWSLEMVSEKVSEKLQQA
jgi:DNA-binding response OmpR family regulator